MTRTLQRLGHLLPLSVAGEVPLVGHDGEDISDVCDRIVDALETQGASCTLYYLPSITLRVPMWRGFRWNNWDIVAPLDRIDLEVRESERGPLLHYRLSLIRLVGLTTLFVLTLPFAASEIARQFPAWMWLVFWGWPVIGSYVFTRMRAHRFFRRVMSERGPLAAVDRPVVRGPIRESGRTSGFPPINWP